MFDRHHRDRHDQRTRDDLARLGMTIVSTRQVELAKRTLADDALQLARLGIVGDAEARETDVVIHQLELGPNRLLYARRFQDGTALPSFLHAQLPGALPVPVTLRKKLLGGVRWYAEAAEIAERLDERADLRAHIKRLPWAQRTSRGTMSLEWVLQLRALGDGTSEVIFQLGSDHMDVFATHLDDALEIVRSLEPALAETTGRLQGLFWPAPFSDLYRQVLAE